jgi:hypothetical protein
MAKELGTFGAIMGFALELEGQAAAFYEAAARESLAARFDELAAGARKRQKRLERVRRENVSEMILESITGLEEATYRVELDPEADEGGLRQQAIALEKATQRFYLDAGAKLPLKDVTRIFKRLARENGRHAAELATK